MLRLLGATVTVLIAVGLALSRVDWTSGPKPPDIARSTPIGLVVCLDPPATVMEWLQRHYQQFVHGHSWKTCQ